jgi:thiol:disulfide interchange protein
MSTGSDHEGKPTGLATGALVLLAALCCGLPLLLAAGALAGLGSVLGNPWVIGAAVALAVGVVTWRLRHRA